MPLEEEEALLNNLKTRQRNVLYVGGTTEDSFNRAYERLKTIHANNKGVLSYIKQCWAGENSPWKPMWPRWARMFRHRHANTTNLVERMWQYV